ncbi:MAG: HDOD domain-containing protein [Nitrospira sp.]|nr:HDOD domain-containing protein [Nitrospira sp.]
MPQVVYKIVEMVRSESSSASDLEREIVVDPAFSAKVLAQANSAFFVLPKRVTSIREAVMFLGFKQVRMIAMQVGVFDFFVGKTDKDSLRRRTWWRHALDTAAAARSLAVEIRKGNADEAYTCGLLHSLGKTLLCRHDAEAYTKVEYLMEHGAPAWQAEQTIYGCHHIEVIQAAGKHWGLPVEIVEGLDYLSPADGDDFANLRAVVAIGEGIATLSTHGSSDPEHDAERLPEWALNQLEIDPDAVQGIVASTLAELAATAAKNH